MSIELRLVSKENIDDVKMILNSVLPVYYSPSFYKQIGEGYWIFLTVAFSILDLQ